MSTANSKQQQLNKEVQAMLIWTAPCSLLLLLWCQQKAYGYWSDNALNIGLGGQNNCGG